jgi:molecular chaperone Hsp33
VFSDQPVRLFDPAEQTNVSMSDSAGAASSSGPAAGLEICTYYVRHRNVLLARAQFTELFVDYFLHVADYHLHPTEEHSALFKDALAAFALHCASRPRSELAAWTLHFEEPFCNVFLAGDNDPGCVTGRVFADDVKRMGQNLFYADVVRDSAPKRRSAVDFEGADAFRAVERYYAQSEQRTARFFDLGEENYAMFTAHPDCDEAWLRDLTAAQVRALPEMETVVALERRRYRWQCGCNPERIMKVLAPVLEADGDGLFGGEASVRVACPRCAARYVITREALEAYAAEHPS